MEEKVVNESIKNIKKETSLENCDLWCIKYGFFLNEYKHIPRAIKKQIKNMDLSIFWIILKFINTKNLFLFKNKLYLN